MLALDDYVTAVFQYAQGRTGAADTAVKRYVDGLPVRQPADSTGHAANGSQTIIDLGNNSAF